MRVVSFFKKILKRDHTFIASSSIQWFGNEYGGFYLDISLLNATFNMLSFGVGEDLSFDLAVSKHCAGNIFLFDPTPKSIDFIKRSGIPPNFHFSPFGISDRDEYADFFLPKNANNVSGSLLVHNQLDSGKTINVRLKTLSTIASELNLSRIDVLKIDIEGSEYKVLRNVMQGNILPVQICVEFHNSFYKNGETLFKETLNLLLENNYEVRAISETGNEYLFVRKQ